MITATIVSVKKIVLYEAQGDTTESWLLVEDEHGSYVAIHGLTVTTLNELRKAIDQRLDKIFPHEPQ